VVIREWNVITSYMFQITNSKSQRYSDKLNEQQADLQGITTQHSGKDCPPERSEGTQSKVCPITMLCPSSQGVLSQQDKQL